MLSMASTYSPIDFLIASCTRVNVVIFYCHNIIHGCGVRILTSTIRVSKTAIYHSFLVAMASNHTFMNYNSRGLHNAMVDIHLCKGSSHELVTL